MLVYLIGIFIVADFIGFATEREVNIFIVIVIVFFWPMLLFLLTINMIMYMV